jgi:hypothetical protein
LRRDAGHREPASEAKGIRIATGTIVDATIIHAPSSTKNAKKERDPAMHQTKKGQTQQRCHQGQSDGQFSRRWMPERRNNI